jgi:hypothetical protein
VVEDDAKPMGFLAECDMGITFMEGGEELLYFCRHGIDDIAYASQNL